MVLVKQCDNIDKIICVYISTYMLLNNFVRIKHNNNKYAKNTSKH